MALFHGVINSKALMKDTTLSMIVPSDDRKNIGFQAFDAQEWPLKLFHACGTEDMLYQDNSSFAQMAKTKEGLEYQYNEYPAGHDFNVWDECSKDFLVWMLK